MLDLSCPGYLQLGQRPKPKPNKTKLKSKIELKQCFWLILCYSEFSVIKKHVLKLEKSMDKAHAYELFIFGAMLGLCWYYYQPRSPPKSAKTLTFSTLTHSGPVNMSIECTVYTIMSGSCLFHVGAMIFLASVTG